MADGILLIAFVNHVFAAHQAYGFEVHTTLQSIVFNNIDDEIPDDIHSEYYFGKCKNPNKVLAYKDIKTYNDIKGRLIVRGEFKRYHRTGNTYNYMWMVPNCVYVRARSKYTDIVRYHAFKFTVCISNMIVQHTNRLYNFVTYEWLVPVEAKEDIIWELYFYV